MTNSCSDAQRSESQHNVLDAVPDAHFIFISRFYSCSHSSALTVKLLAPVWIGAVLETAGFHRKFVNGPKLQQIMQL